MLDEPNCSIRKCKHFLGVGGPESDDGNGEEFEVNICEAFPDGIPEDIAYGDNKHSTPLPNQKNAIVYELENKVFRRKVEKGKRVNKMKIISLVGHSIDSITLWIKDAGYYKEIGVDMNNNVELITQVETKQYKNYAYFAAVMGKFNPYTFFMKDPIPIKKLDFEELIVIAFEYEKKQREWARKSKKEDAQH